MRFVLLALIATLIVMAIRPFMRSSAERDANAEANPGNELGDAATSAAEAVEPTLTQLSGTERPSVHFELDPSTDDSPLISKVGGVPFWPKEEPLPSHNGKPLIHLAQINFRQMPTMAGYPSHGILQFFIADDDLYGADFENPTKQAGFAVRYWPWPDESQPHRQDWPHQPEAMAPHVPGQVLAMSFSTPADELIPVGDVDFDRYAGESAWSLAERLAAENNVSEDAVFEALPSGAGHKIGGYPDFTQEDPRAADSPWQLLLQLDSDEHIMWGDVGIGNFFISADALANRDFSKVLYNWDCH